MAAEEFVCERDGVRLDAFLARRLPGYSRGHLQGLIREERVLVGGATADPDKRLKSGDRVTVSLGRGTRPDWGRDLERRILLEDSDLLVLDKPAGLLMHPAGPSWLSSPEAALEGEENLAGAMLLRRPGIVRSGTPRCGLVHRLDRPTSGVLVVAKTPEAHARLLEDFKLRRLRKVYRAVVRGRFAGASARVDAPVASRGGRPASATPFGRPAQTEIRRVSEGPDATLVEAMPVTGRTHQIRAHLAFMGHPVAGDPAADRAGGRPREPVPPRLMLHAYRLELDHPRTGRPLILEAPLPADFRDFWRRVSRRRGRRA